MRRWMLGVLVVVVVCVATVVTAAPAGGSKGRGDAKAKDRDDALAAALVFHRSDIRPSTWLAPVLDPFPCTPASSDVDVSASRDAGWIETGKTFIRRVMWSRVETSGTPDALFRQRVAEIMKCLGGEAARQTPRFEGPPRLKIRAFHGTASWGSNPGDLDIMVVKVGRAVAQYAYAWVWPPYHASGLARVRQAVARGVKAA